MNQTYLITTARLGLRQWQNSDLPHYKVMNQDSDVMHFFPYKLTTHSKSIYCIGLVDDFLPSHSLEPMTEKETKAHYEKIFETEFLPHADALKTFAYHLAYNEEDANDLVQETYLKAYRFIDKYHEGTNAKAWLFKILKNAFINAYRKKSKRPTKVDFEDIIAYHDTDDDRVTGYMDLRAEIFQYMMGDEITIAINALPVDFRTVILLCDVEDFTYEEISKIIDIPIGTVRSRLFRARNMLKETLRKYAESLGYKDMRGQKQIPPKTHQKED